MLFTKLLAGATALLGTIASASPVAHKRAASAGPKTVVDPNGVYMRATHLDDGSILGAYAVGSGANHHLAAVRSTNNGASWTTVGTIVTANSDTTDLDNADVVNLGGGTVLAAFRNHDLDANKRPTYYRITVCVSHDNGATWQFLSQADEREAFVNNGLWEPFLRVARDGSVQIYYSRETQGYPDDQDNVMKHSSDGGKTWSGIVPVSGQGITTRDGMTGVASVDGGANLICVFENTRDDYFSVDYVLSSDDGLSWGSRGTVYKAATAKDAGAPQVVLVGNTLVASFITNENGGGSPRHVDGGNMKTVESTDGGRTWSGPTTVSPVGSHWGGLLTIGNEFLVMVAVGGSGLVSQPWAL